MAQMQYPGFAAAGWPLGSGVVESANKGVVEARLKGAGMRWARAHVDPMIVLRASVYSDRWEEEWTQITTELCKQARRRAAHQGEPPCPALPGVPGAPAPMVAPAPPPLSAPMMPVAARTGSSGCRSPVATSVEQAPASGTTVVRSLKYKSMTDTRSIQQFSF